MKETVYRSVLTLDSDRETVNGTYLCIAENSLGTAQDTVIVNVRKKMRIMENFTGIMSYGYLNALSGFLLLNISTHR